MLVLVQGFIKATEEFWRCCPQNSLALKMQVPPMVVEKREGDSSQRDAPTPAHLLCSAANVSREGPCDVC